MGKTRLVEGPNSWPEGGQRRLHCLKCHWIFKSRDKANRLCWRCVNRNALLMLGQASPVHLARFGRDE